MRNKVFVGRENELEMFRTTLDKTTAENKPDKPFANTFLLYGVGGMGKTYLCKKFAEITREAYPSSALVFIDWDARRRKGSTFTPQELLNTVALGFREYFPGQLKPYDSALEGMRKVREEIETALERQKQSLGNTADVADTAVSTATANPLIGKAVSTIFKMGGKKLSEREARILKEKAGVSDDHLFLYNDPDSAMALRLKECIDTVTREQDHSVVLILDTCELITAVEEWFNFNFLVPLVNGNTNMVLVFSGRHNPYTQRKVVIDGKTDLLRGMADIMTFPPRTIDMQKFSRPEIENYLNEMGLTGFDAPVIDFLQTFSRGVPFAVNLLTDALDKLGTKRFLEDFGNREFRESLGREVSGDAIIRQVAERFLRYCIEDGGNREDRDRIFSIAILEDMNPAVLELVWEVDNPGDILDDLQAKYALFIERNRLHDVVKDFLLDHIAAEQLLRQGTAAKIAGKALPVYREAFDRENAEYPDLEERAADEFWKDARQRLLNALAWYSPGEAVDFFIGQALEMFLISKEQVRQMKKLLDRFLNLDKCIRPKKRGKINLLMEALRVFKWNIRFGSQRERMGTVISFCSKAMEEWQPEPFAGAVLQLVQGRCLYNRKDYDGALAILLERVDEKQLDKSLGNKLAEALHEVGKKFSLDRNNDYFYSESALRAFQKAVAINDKKSNYQYSYAVMLRLSGKYQEAIKNCRKAIEIDPKSAYALNELGIVYRQMGEYEEAIKNYRKAIELDPKFAAPLNGLGIVYQQMGENEEAIKNYRKAIELDPKYAHPLNSLGYVYLVQKQFKEANHYFQKRLELEEDLTTYINSGIAHYCLDEKQKAREHFEQGLACAKEYQDIHTLFNKITAYIGLGKGDEAAALLETLAGKSYGQGFIEGFFTDWNLLLTSPHPPEGLAGFIEKAKKRLTRFEHDLKD
ncbi:MAG: tetratricopeptide repeat protein [bacterium]|nr:tetratricopeptide repeat protein [bacterium]